MGVQGNEYLSGKEIALYTVGIGLLSLLVAIILACGGALWARGAARRFLAVLVFMVGAVAAVALVYLAFSLTLR